MRASLSVLLLRSGSRWMGSGAADWAQAMSAEMEACEHEGDRLRWALGCWRASLSAPGAWTRCAHPLALTFGAALMAAYEWTNDEGIVTLILLIALGLTLGLLRPARAAISGALLGLVVSAVLSFELLTGMRTSYEMHPVTTDQCLHWTLFVVPTLLAALIGSGVARRLSFRQKP